MKTSTHYSFSLGLTNLFLLLEQRFDPSLLGLSVIFSLICSFMSVLPNYMDKRVSISAGAKLQRNRHPLTHSPWTVLYFLPFLYLSEVVDAAIIQIIVSLSTISWCSHLLLDLLNPGGIPIGKKPVFNNHPIKHYHLRINNKKYKRIQLACIPFNDIRVNRNLSYIGLFLFSMNLTTTFFAVLGGI